MKAAGSIKTALDGLVTLTPTTSGRNTITAQSAGVVPLTVKGAASQTGDLFQAQDSAAALKAGIRSDGYLKAAGLLATGDTGPYISTLGGAGVLVENRTTASLVPFTVKGMAAQTANLRESQTSAGTVLESLSASGALGLKTDVWHISTDARHRLHFGNNGHSYYKSSLDHYWRVNNVDSDVMGLTAAGQLALLVTGSAGGLRVGGDLDFYRSAANEGTIPDRLVQISPAAGTVPSVVKGAVSQTANLQEWQDSAGVVKMSVRYDGYPSVPGLTSTASDSPYINWGANGPFRINNAFLTASNKVFQLTGAAGQTGALQEWTNDSFVALLRVIAGGALEFPEQSDPAAGATNNARLYSRDNGSGKTQLCVRFPTGAIQVLATEP